MTANNQTEDKIPAAEAQQEATQSTDAKDEATGTASDELSEDDLQAVAGGGRIPGPGPHPDPRLIFKPPVFNV